MTQEFYREKDQAKLTLTIEEAAKLLGIGRGLAYEMARTGQIPTVRFGRRMLVPKIALDRILNPEISTG